MEFKKIFRKYYYEISSLVISFFLILFKILGLINWNWIAVTVLLWFPLVFTLGLCALLFVPGLLFLIFRDEKWNNRE